MSALRADNPLRERLRNLIKEYGSLRAVGRALEIDHAYLYRLNKGECKNPSDRILKKLGLKKRIVFYKI